MVTTVPSDFPTTPGAYDTSYNGYVDAFVTKLDTSVQWTDYFNRQGNLSDGANAVAVSPDGRKVFAAGYTTTAEGGRAFSVMAHDATDGATLWKKYVDGEGNLPDEAMTVAVSPDGSKVFAAGYTTTSTYGRSFSVMAYDATDGAILRETDVNGEGKKSLPDEAMAIAVSPDGSKVFAAGYTTTSEYGMTFYVLAHDGTDGAILWEDFFLAEITNLPDEAKAVAVSPNGSMVFVAGYTSTSAGGRAFSVLAYDATDGKVLWQKQIDRKGDLDDVANAVAVSPDGSKVFAAGYTTSPKGGKAFYVIAYNATNGVMLWEDYNNKAGNLADEANAVAVSPDGSKVIAAGYTSTSAGGKAFSVRAYNAINGKLRWQKRIDIEGKLDDKANAVAVSGDGRKVFVAGYTSTRTPPDAPSVPAFSVMAFKAASGKLLWRSQFKRIGGGKDLPNKTNAIAVFGDNVFAAGYTTTTTGGSAFTIRAYRPQRVTYPTHPFNSPLDRAEDTP